MDFVQDLRSVAESILDLYGLAHSTTEETIDVIRRWVNVQLKLISPLPRNVHRSSDVVSKTSDLTLQAIIQNIQHKFENGADVNGHLSKTIFKEDYTDYLFSDWGFYHLHLSTTKNPTTSYFYDRSDRLLFVTINGNNAYFIDIRDHDEDYVFAQKELLTIVHNTWPHIIAPYCLTGLSVEQDITNPEDIHKLRKAGVMVIYKIGDASYTSAGGGLNTAATSVRMVIESDRLVRMARSAQEWVIENNDEMSQDIKTVFPDQTKIDFHLIMNSRGFFVVDNISHLEWPIKV